MHTCIQAASREKVARVCLYFIMAAGVIGCERPPAGPGHNKLPSQGDLIVLVGPARSSPQLTGIVGGARRCVEEYAAPRLETLAPADNSSQALSRAGRAALSKQPHAICLYVSNAAAARPAASEIAATGTILVTMGIRSGVRGVFGHVRVDFPGAAELLGKHLTEIAGDKRSYVLLHSDGASPADSRCYQRFMRIARSYQGITLLEERNISAEQKTPAELLREMFARFRYAGLAVTLDPTPWLSTPPAELLGAHARFATLGASPPLWAHLQSGEAAALVGPLDGEIGWLAVELALTGITESGKAGLVRTAENHLVTRETLDDFAKRYAEAAGLELDELLSPASASRPAGLPAPVVEP